MAQYTQRTQSMHRAGVGQTSEHGAALAYGAKPPPTVAGASTAPGPQPRLSPAPTAYQPHAQLRLQPYTLSYRDGGYGRDYVRAGGAGRISLLPASAQYLAPPAAAQPASDPPPFKKIRLAAERHAQPALPAHPAHQSHPAHHQLRVDTREPVSGYNSTVELLSPNSPTELTVEDQNFRTTKDDLLQQISKVDREMALSEQMLSKLKRKHEELLQAAGGPAVCEDVEVETPRHRCLAQSVLADNRKKAERAVAAFEFLRTPEQKEKWPLYNQPQDTEVYHANKLRHLAFRPKLLEHLRRVKKERDAKRQAFADEYAKRAAAWMRRVERIEQGQKRKAKEARNREFFEKVFPELRKQREDRERFNRVGARVKSEAELEEIVDGLQEQEMEEKKMRSLAVVPPLAAHCRPLMYTDTNGVCSDMEADHKELAHVNVWTPQEKELFKEKYLQNPKNFGAIASYFSRKSVRDCVRFYYLTKKTEKYKQLLRKSRQRRTVRNSARNLAALQPDIPPRVTRFQRAQGVGLARSVEKEPGGPDGLGPLVCIPVPSESVPLPPTPADDGAHHAALPARMEVTESRSPPLPSSPAPAPAPVAGGAVSSASPAVSAASALAAVTSVPAQTAPKVASPHPESATPLTDIERVPTPVTSPVAPEEMTSTASEAPVVTSSPATSAAMTPAAVSVTVSQPQSPQPQAQQQPIPQPQPQQQPQNEAPMDTQFPQQQQQQTQLPQQQQTQPPQQQTQPSQQQTQPTLQPQMTMQTQHQPPENGVAEPSSTPSAPCVVCGGPGTRGVTRARAHYYGLHEDGVSASARVCETCHCKCVRSRYTRCPVPTCPGPKVRAKRLRHLPPRWHDLPHDLKQPVMEEFQIPSELSKCCLACFKRITRRIESEGASEPGEEEAARFRSLLREHGTEWSGMAAATGRSAATLKAFYFSYRKRFGLDAAVGEKDARAPRSSDDDDSAAATSCDTDTASAESPRPPPPPEPAPRPRVPALHAPADPYDSSATETADEENDAPAARHSPKRAPSAPPAPPPAPGAPPQRNGPAPPVTPGSSLTVNDIVLNVIEYSMFKTTPGGKPAAPPPQKPLECRPAAPPREALATLSVVNAQHNTSPAPRSPHRPATITPVAAPAPDAPKEGVVLVQLDRPRAPEQEPLLDLSVKRPRDRGFPAAHAKPASVLYRNTSEYAYRPAPEREPAAHYAPHAPAAKPGKAPPAARAKPLNPKGSITHGTPVEPSAVSPRQERPRRTPPDAKGGSITAGTPVLAPHHLSDKRAYEYYAQRRSPAAPGVFYSATPPANPRAPSPQTFASPSFSRSPYGPEQRQIIMADYITSRTMDSAARRAGERPASPQYQPGGQRREGVIQRHTPHAPAHPAHPAHPTHPQHHYQQIPSGHEAFSSLVEAAVASPSLPVPRSESKPTDRHTPPVSSSHNHLPSHDYRIQDRMHRDMANKYHQHHQIQIQAMERERRHVQHAQFMDRQLAMQQGRERDRDRAMAALQERQMMDQHLHERHHAASHAQQVATSEERRAASGGAGAVYSTASRHMPPHSHLQLERKECSRVVVSSTVSVTSSNAPVLSHAPAAAAERAPPAKTEQLTAANIIDAIIMSQINQTAVEPSVGRGLASLMSSRDSEGSSLPPLSAAHAPSVSTSGGSAGGGGAPPQQEAGPPQNTTSFKLGDLASNIITRDFCSPTTHLYRYNSSGGVESRGAGEPGGGGGAGAGGGGGAAGGGAGGSLEDWKRAREAPPPKHAPYLEPVSPPDNHHLVNRSSSGGARRYGSANSALTAYDYVANRIVEVMRDGVEEPRKSTPAVVSAFPPTSYYPFSVLNVATTDSAPPPRPSPLRSCRRSMNLSPTRTDLRVHSRVPLYILSISSYGVVRAGWTLRGRTSASEAFRAVEAVLDCRWTGRRGGACDVTESYGDKRLLRSLCVHCDGCVLK